jgi:hypothetical protein
MSDDVDLINKLFEFRLAAERERVKTAKGLTPQDYKYAQAESVSPTSMLGYVVVVFQGQEYGPARITHGSLEEDLQNTSTVLIRTDDGIYWKLWFYNSDWEQ